MPTLFQRLTRTTDIDRYRHSQGLAYTPPTTTGLMVLPILEFLRGVPCCDLVLAYVHAFSPSVIRVRNHDQEETSDGRFGRVTIRLAENGTVAEIVQEVACGYACGAEVDEVLDSI